MTLFYKVFFVESSSSLLFPRDEKCAGFLVFYGARQEGTRPEVHILHNVFTGNSPKQMADLVKRQLIEGFHEVIAKGGYRTTKLQDDGSYADVWVPIASLHALPPHLDEVVKKRGGLPLEEWVK